VWIDQKKAQYDVAKKTILENNCKRVLYIAGKKNAYVTEKRIEGIEELAKEMDLELTIEWGEFSELSARNITLKFAKNKDVVICASDLMAIGAMKALTDMDIFRPVCGFDGIMLMGYVGKLMNTVSQHFNEVSSNAVMEMQRLMLGENGRNVVLSYTLDRIEYNDIIC
jgi:LacI family transcriptional regulator